MSYLRAKGWNGEIELSTEGILYTYSTKHQVAKIKQNHFFPYERIQEIILKKPKGFSPGYFYVALSESDKKKKSFFTLSNHEQAIVINSLEDYEQFYEAKQYLEHNYLVEYTKETVYKGDDASLIVSPEKVIIQYHRNHPCKSGQKVIYVDEILQINKSAPKWMTIGTMVFYLENEYERRFDVHLDDIDIENTIKLTTPKQYDLFMDAIQQIQTYSEQYTEMDPSSQKSDIDQLREYKIMLEEGLITEEEYEEKKNEILFRS